VRIIVDNLATFTSKKLVPNMFFVLMPLLDMDISPIEWWRLVSITWLDLDNVNTLDGIISEDFLEDSLHLLPRHAVVNAGNIDRWNIDRRHECLSLSAHRM
jgi:hypothetical protein